MIVLALAALIYTGVRLSRLRWITDGTTTEIPRRWAQVAIAVCGIGAILILMEWNLAASVCHALAAVMLLTPSIAVLGARRPGADVWSWFIILPLVLVLLWPILAELPRAATDQILVLPLPTVLGFLLVLLMGAGNYFGTGNTLAVLIAAVGTLLILHGATELGPAEAAYVAGCCCLALASRLLPAHFVCQVQRRNEGMNVPANRLWYDFRDLYGIVWAKRVMDRVNVFAERENWPVLLTLDGFHRRESGLGAGRGAVVEQLPARADQIFRWLLGRFLEPEFVGRYLGPSDERAGVAEETGGPVTEASDKGVI